MKLLPRLGLLMLATSSSIAGADEPAPTAGCFVATYSASLATVFVATGSGQVLWQTIIQAEPTSVDLSSDGQRLLLTYGTNSTSIFLFSSNGANQTLGVADPGSQDGSIAFAGWDADGKVYVQRSGRIASSYKYFDLVGTPPASTLLPAGPVVQGVDCVRSVGGSAPVCATASTLDEGGARRLTVDLLRFLGSVNRQSMQLFIGVPMSIQGLPLQVTLLARNGKSGKVKVEYSAGASTDAWLAPGEELALDTGDAKYILKLLEPASSTSILFNLIGPMSSLPGIASVLSLGSGNIALVTSDRPDDKTAVQVWQRAQTAPGVFAYVQLTGDEFLPRQKQLFAARLLPRSVLQVRDDAGVYEVSFGLVPMTPPLAVGGFANRVVLGSPVLRPSTLGLSNGSTLPVRTWTCP